MERYTYQSLLEADFLFFRFINYLSIFHLFFGRYNDTILLGERRKIDQL